VESDAVKHFISLLLGVAAILVQEQVGNSRPRPAH